MNDFKTFDGRKPKPKPKPHKPIKYGKVRKIRDHSKYHGARPEKVQEIKAVWSSPKFRDDNSRLVYLFRHCTSPEYGYTAREFATAKFPDKMNGDYWEVEYAIKLVHQIFNRFRHNIDNHEIILHPMLKKLKGDTIYRYHYYNIIDDEEARKEMRRRAALNCLGLTRTIQKLQDLAERGDEIQAAREKRYQEIEKSAEERRMKEQKQQQEKIQREREHTKINPDGKLPDGQASL
ncbi:MAG: hypothetical protein WA393_03150 [Nitrososphaeraceae archaeon]